MRLTLPLLALFVLFFLGINLSVSAQSSFTLPGDGKWYKVAATAGQHAWFEYSYSHGTGHNPSIATGEIQFINAQNHTVQYHQTMGYNGWNQPQFALVNTGNEAHVWVRATNGVDSGTFTLLRSRNTSLAVPGSGVTELGGGTVTIYDKLSDNAHSFNGNVSIRNGNLQARGYADGLFTALKLVNLQGSGDVNTSVGIDFHHFDIPDKPNARIYERESNSTGTYGGSLIFSTRTQGGASEETQLVDRMVIDHTGKVGIGTTNLADNMLSVNGKIRAKEIKVESNWADFVFEPGYRLRPLEEVEQHIKAHGHLPDVPSAAEVQENGVDLGKTDALLLQKIEELTLYIIDQERKTKQLEDRLLQLEMTEN